MEIKRSGKLSVHRPDNHPDNGTIGLQEAYGF